MASSFLRDTGTGRPQVHICSPNGTPGFQDEGDNEITGIHVSDGDPSVAGLIGTRVPRPFAGRWRFFWTQQHGDNVTWEVTRPGSPSGD